MSNSSTVTSSGSLRRNSMPAEKRQRFRTHRRDVPGHRNAGSRQRLHQALGRGAVGSIHFTPNTKALVSYVYQGEESIPRLGFPTFRNPRTVNGRGRVTNVGYNGNGTAVGVVPIQRSNWFGVVAGPLADVVTHRNPHYHGRSRTRPHNDIKATNATRYLLNDRFARPTAPRILGGSNNIPLAARRRQNPVGFPPTR